MAEPVSPETLGKKAEPKPPRTLGEETFKWLKEEKSLEAQPGRPPRDTTKRQRHSDIRIVARKEIADLTKLADMLPKDQVDKIFTLETLKPMVEALFQARMVPAADADLVKAELARLFILEGFTYLSGTKPYLMDAPHMRAQYEAFDMVNLLVESFKPEGKRFFHSSYPGAY